ncbi:hypothetical protein FA048_10665 [Pedobacter polaris]|uniref:DUF5723 domain-containing protein n=1 Tax=Pedobacter polaris TaxID=2571273 RepID=A0A4U1CRE5_9SPHI|nr:DUF5723 family protein [Pedobacter polaris]TKC10631.1 hypothetical protein FA048_10665 [Pedobacter polaris]
MKKIYFLLIGFLLLASEVGAQHYALYNTRTLFDAFENPAIRTFTLDSSGKFASNFFLPNFSINAANKGSAESIIRSITNERIYNTETLPLGTGELNKVFQNTNIYLLTFRIFSSYKYNQEVGFAWQLRSDAYGAYTNESLAIFDNYQRFSEQTPYNDVFNNSAYQQSYHQFSVSVRENWDKRLAFGLKLSLLSGIAYNSLQINNSYFYSDIPNERLDIGLNGIYKGSFIASNELERKNLIPTFKNPGLSMTIGTTYASKSGYFLMGNIKDLGFIRWNKDSHVAKLNALESIYNLSTKSTEEINNQITDLVYDADEQKSFVTTTNAKADFLISRTFGFYKPSFIVSKNLFHSGGDLALVNTFKVDKFSASLTPVYNFNNFIMIGVQGMYRTPNFEFFLGSDNIGKSISLAKGIKQSDATIGTGYNAGSVYMGLGIKFGRTVNHPMNLSTMPGVNGEKPYKGFFRSLFTFFKK